MSKVNPQNQDLKNQSPGFVSLEVVQTIHSSKVLELLRPGSFVTLDNQPKDLPPFQVIHCRGGLCSVRQQSWGQYVQWEVEHNRLKSA